MFIPFIIIEFDKSYNFRIITQYTELRSEPFFFFECNGFIITLRWKLTPSLACTVTSHTPVFFFTFVGVCRESKYDKAFCSGPKVDIVNMDGACWGADLYLALGIMTVKLLSRCSNPLRMVLPPWLDGDGVFIWVWTWAWVWWVWWGWWVCLCRRNVSC